MIYHFQKSKEKSKKRKENKTPNSHFKKKETHWQGQGTLLFLNCYKLLLKSSILLHNIHS